MLEPSWKYFTQKHDVTWCYLNQQLKVVQCYLGLKINGVKVQRQFSSLKTFLFLPVGGSYFLPQLFYVTRFANGIWAEVVCYVSQLKLRVILCFFCNGSNRSQIRPVSSLWVPEWRCWENSETNQQRACSVLVK